MRYLITCLALMVFAFIACTGNTLSTAQTDNTDNPSLLVWGYVDDGCQLLDGATVRFHCETCNEDWPKAVTDDRGIYTIEGEIPPTHIYHRVTGVASCEGYIPATIEFTSWPGSPTLVSFTLTPESE